MWNKVKKQKIPHCRKSSKIKIVGRGKIDTLTYMTVHFPDLVQVLSVNSRSLGILLGSICFESHLFCRGYLYLFTCTGVQHDFHIRWCSCRLTVTWRVSHVELLTLPGHMSSPPVFRGVHVAQFLVSFLCNVL